MANGPGGGPQTQVIIPGQGWVDVASRVIVQVGFPVVVAGVLLWFLLTRFQDNMNAITTRMGQNAAAVEMFVGELKAQTQELKAQSQYMAQHAENMNAQLALLRKIEDDASLLVKVRRDELETIKRATGEKH